jgi:GDP-4-dehydro-6-deoxy-D-mannose reductase
VAEILVTGASGFVGTHLIPRLRDAGHRVITVTRTAGDVEESSTWEALPAAEVVIHLAARASVPESWQEPELYIRSNLLGTLCALHYCRTREARLVFTSSYMYGAPETLPISESAPLIARNPYALSKKLAEEACRFYAESFGVDVTVLRPFNVYGRGQSESFLVPSIVRQMRAGGEIRVKDLAPRRDYVYVRDVVDGILAAAEGGKHGFRALNIASGTSYSVGELVNTIQEVGGSDLPVVSEEERRKDEIMDTVADVGEAKRQLGWAPRFSLREGIEDMLGPGVT